MYVIITSRPWQKALKLINLESTIKHLIAKTKHFRTMTVSLDYCNIGLLITNHDLCWFMVVLSSMVSLPLLLLQGNIHNPIFIMISRTNYKITIPVVSSEWMECIAVFTLICFRSLLLQFLAAEQLYCRVYSTFHIEPNNRGVPAAE